MKETMVPADVAEFTTISVPPPVKERIARFRRHPRETWEDILTYIMDLADKQIREGKP